MAKEKKKNPSLLDATQVKNTGKATAIGTYLEAPGGGTPLGKGEKAPGGKNGPWVRANRRMQPRDAEGKFTYNSANNKTLKYGPSRGWTVPPFLLGSRCLYAIKKKSSVATGGKVYWAGVDMSIEEFVEECKEYRPESDIRQSMKGKPGGGSKTEKTEAKSGARGFISADDKSAKTFYSKESLITGYMRTSAKIKGKKPGKRKFAIEKTKDTSGSTGSSSSFVAPTTPTTPTTSGSGSKSSNMSPESAGKIKSILADVPELEGITEQDIIDMYDSGELTDEDLDEMGIKL